MLLPESRRILITRTRSQASELAAAIQALGATPILIPTIELAPPISFAALDHALAHLTEYDWLVFTSANAVQAFSKRALDRDLPQPAHPQIAVIGPATARAAIKLQLAPCLLPERAVAEDLAEALVPRIVTGTRILLIRAAVARDHLPEALTAAGARVDIADAYRTLTPPDSVEALKHLFGDPGNYPDAITFTSSSTASNLLTLLEAAGVTLPPDIIRASIGPVTSQTLRDLNLPPHLEAAEATIPSLAKTLETYFSRSLRQ